MILSFFIAIAIIGVAIGSYTDIKTLEVPDWLNYSMIAIGIAGNLMFSIYYSDPKYILYNLAGFIVSFAIGMLMFYTGQWGGGDSKVLFGVGALIGLDYTIISSFYVNFLFNTAIAGALWGLICMTYKAILNRKTVSKKIIVMLKEKKLARIRLFSGIAAILGLLAVYFAPGAIDSRLRLIFSTLMIMLYFMNYLFIIVKAVEESAMIKFVHPEKLTEGDWIVDEIKIDGKYITGPKDLGIEKDKIEMLVNLRKDGKIDRIKVKYGIPFVPGFLAGLLYTAITNSIVLYLFI